MSRAESRTFDFLLFMQEEVAREGYTWTPKYLQMTWLTGQGTEGTSLEDQREKIV